MPQQNLQTTFLTGAAAVGVPLLQSRYYVPLVRALIRNPVNPPRHHQKETTYKTGAHTSDPLKEGVWGHIGGL